MLYIGKAQEKARVLRTQAQVDPASGRRSPELAFSTALPNAYYFYAVDADFGSFFLKFCSYFPYNAKLCLNGHEYVKRQLEKEGIAFEALDNGILSCADPQRLQQLCTQVAGPAAASVQPPRPAGRPALSRVGAAGGVLAHAGVRPPGQQAHAVTLPHACDHRGGGSLAALRLQEDADQAIMLIST